MRTASVARLSVAEPIRLVDPLSSFLAGAALAAGVAVVIAARARRASRAPAAASPATATMAAAPTVAGTTAREPAANTHHALAPFAAAVADDVATFASGIEGRAHALVEAAASRVDVPRAAEDLLAAARRLRTLHARLAALAGKTPAASPTAITDVEDLVARVSAELQTAHVGLEVRWDPPDHLPRLRAPFELAFDALATACRALLHAEHGASRLTIAAEACYAGETPQLQLECTIEWTRDGGGTSADLLVDPRFALDREAAERLAHAAAGALAFHQLRGRSARVVVRWPTVAEAPDEAAAHAAPAHAPREHRYGGALLLESDPAVRAMLAAELKASGRAVFVCADATAAGAFLRATPDRFELLIVDRNDRLHDRDLAQAVRTLAPSLDVLALDEPDRAVDAAWPRLRRITKPFGVHELRRALAPSSASR